MPGVHIPHCAAPYRCKACWSGLRAPSFAKPSTVWTSWPSNCPAAVKQAKRCSPSMRMVQAPQSPASHPTLVPVRPSSYLKTSEVRETGLEEIEYPSPFRMKRMVLDPVSTSIMSTHIFLVKCDLRITTNLGLTRS